MNPKYDHKRKQYKRNQMDKMKTHQVWEVWKRGRIEDNTAPVIVEILQGFSKAQADDYLDRNYDENHFIDQDDAAPFRICDWFGEVKITTSGNDAKE